MTIPATGDVPLKWIKNTGRNGWDPPIEVSNTQSVESRNVYLYKGGLGTRRGGSVSVSIAGVTPPIIVMFEYVGTSLAAAELWLEDSSSPVKILRCHGGASFTNETLIDNMTTRGADANAVTLNQKLYWAYASGVNRLHVYDPNNASADTVRRTGIRAFGVAPTAADQGSGSYPAVLRYYRVRSSEQQAGVTVRRSEPSPSVALTPSGSGAAAHVVRPTSVGEGETHWELEGSLDNVIFYVVYGDAPGAIGVARPIGSTSVDDNSTPANWPLTLTASAPSGTYVCFPSVKCLGSTGTRIYGFGAWETSVAGAWEMAPKNGRLYFSPVLDTTLTDDSERISNSVAIQGWIDASRNAGSVDRGCASKPVNNIIYCFQDRGVYGFYPTESDITPYRRVIFSTAVGNLAQQAIVVAIDYLGYGACYFLDPVLGPYTVGGTYGLRWCGKDVADIWATVNRDALSLAACGEWFPDRSQIIWLLATNGSNSPNFAIALDPTKMRPDDDNDLRGGWTTYDGDWVKSFCIRTFSNTLNATRSAVRTPYTGGAGKLLRYDETVQQDDATPFMGYVTSGAQAVEIQSLTVDLAYVVASAETGVTLQQSFIRNTGDEVDRVASVDLTPIATETTVLRKLEDASVTDAWAFQVQLGDPAPANVAWQILQWRARLHTGTEL